MSPWSNTFELHQFLVFFLVLVRVSSLMLIAPLFGAVPVPPRVRALLALAMALLITPLEWEKHTELPETLPGILVLAGGETIVGLSLGLGVLVLVSAMQVAGSLISQLSGMQLADVIDPGLDTSVPVFSQLLNWVALAVFVLIGGHRSVMAALLDTFAWLPAGQGGFSRSVLEAMVVLLSQSFMLGVRAAAPAIASLLLATLILGLASRTLPQLNVMALGFGLNVLVALAMLGLALGGGAWMLADEALPGLESLLASLRPQ